MNYSVLLCLLILQTAFASAQPVHKRVFKDKTGSFTYSYYHAAVPAKGVLIGFYDASAKDLSAEAFCESLKNLAEDAGWNILVPHQEIDNSVNLTLFNRLMQLYADSLKTNRKLFVSLGSGSKSAFECMSVELPGVMIVPTVVHQAQVPNGFLPEFDVHNFPLAVVSTSSADSGKFIADSLAAKGIWMDYDSLPKSDSFNFSSHNDVWARKLFWVDSLNAALRDSLNMIEIKARSGVQGSLPEVLRQSQTLSFNIWITEPNKYSFQFIELSGKIAFEMNRQLFNGLHHVELPTANLNWGVYTMTVQGGNIKQRFKIMIKG